MRNFSTRSFFVLLILVAMFQVSVNAQQPRVRFNLPSGGFTEVCLETAAASVDVQDDTDILIIADAAANDLGCPGADPIINSLSVSPAVLDITTLNCDLDNNAVDDAVCLFVNWNITPAISQTSCDIQQIEPVAKFSMNPFQFSNPSSFVDPGNPTIFTPVINGLEWPVNVSTATAGLKRFRMTCSSLGGGTPISAIFESTFVDGADPTVTIDTFNVTETSADQGTTINFNWNVTLNNGPPAPTCTLSSPSTINSVSVPVTAAPGSSTATILNTSPLGSRTFTFSCRPDTGSPVTDTATDNVTITVPPVSCVGVPTVVPNRDTSRTTFQSALGSIWPGSNADPFNIAVNANQYMALQFTVPATSESGAISTVAPPVPNTGGLIISIDRCPGVLQTADGACDVNFPAVKANVNWRHSISPSPVGCVLDVGEIYYLNLFFGDRNGVSACTFSECVTRMRNLF